MCTNVYNIIVTKVSSLIKSTTMRVNFVHPSSVHSLKTTDCIVKHITLKINLLLSTHPHPLIPLKYLNKPLQTYFFVIGTGIMREENFFFFYWSNKEMNDILTLIMEAGKGERPWLMGKELMWEEDGNSYLGRGRRFIFRERRERRKVYLRKMRVRMLIVW